MRAHSFTAPRLTFLVLAVTGIVVGLLGMHTVTLSPSEGGHSAMSGTGSNASAMPMPHAMPMETTPTAAANTLISGTSSLISTISLATATSPAVTDSVTRTDPVTPITTHGEPAGGDCTTCMALQMTCALGLLVIGAMLLRGPTPGQNLLPTLLASVHMHVTSRIPPHRAPSLDVLCISRT